MVAFRVVPISNEKGYSKPLKKYDFLKTFAIALADNGISSVAPSNGDGIDINAEIISTETHKDADTLENEKLAANSASTAEQGDEDNTLLPEIDAAGDDDEEDAAAHNPEDFAALLKQLLGGMGNPEPRPTNDKDISMIVQYLCLKERCNETSKYCTQLGVDLTEENQVVAEKELEFGEMLRALVPLVKAYVEPQETAEGSNVKNIVKISQAMKPLNNAFKTIIDLKGGVLIDSDAPLADKVQLLMRNYAKEQYFSARQQLAAFAKELKGGIQSIKADDRKGLLQAFELNEDPLFEPLIPSDEELAALTNVTDVDNSSSEDQPDNFQENSSDIANGSDEDIHDDNVQKDVAAAA